MAGVGTSRRTIPRGHRGPSHRKRAAGTENPPITSGLQGRRCQADEDIGQSHEADRSLAIHHHGQVLARPTHLGQCPVQRHVHGQPEDGALEGGRWVQGIGGHGVADVHDGREVSLPSNEDAPVPRSA
jgi:hypothetical protein